MIMWVSVAMIEGRYLLAKSGHRRVSQPRRLEVHFAQVPREQWAELCHGFVQRAQHSELPRRGHSGQCRRPVSRLRVGGAHVGGADGRDGRELQLHEGGELLLCERAEKGKDGGTPLSHCVLRGAAAAARCQLREEQGGEEWQHERPVGGADRALREIQERYNGDAGGIQRALGEADVPCAPGSRLGPGLRLGLGLDFEQRFRVWARVSLTSASGSTTKRVRVSRKVLSEIRSSSCCLCAASPGSPHRASVCTAWVCTLDWGWGVINSADMAVTAAAAAATARSNKGRYCGGTGETRGGPGEMHIWWSMCPISAAQSLYRAAEPAS